MDEFTTRQEEPAGIGRQSFEHLSETILELIFGYLMPGTTFQKMGHGLSITSVSFMTNDCQRVTIQLEDY